MQLRKISVLLTAALILSCENGDSLERNYVPNEGIDVSIKITKFDEIMIDDEELDFIYYDLIIMNQSSDKYCFSIRDIDLSINGIRSNSTHIDSLAAHEGHYEPYNLPLGTISHHLYSVFPEDTLEVSIRDFEIVEFGLDSEGGCTELPN